MVDETKLENTGEGRLSSIAGESALATVRTMDDGRTVLSLSDGSTASMRRAVSCLVAPEPGDRVLTAEADGVHYVLAVLERPGADRTSPVRIETDGELIIAADTITLKTAVLNILARKLTAIGEAWNSLFKNTQRIVGVETVTASTTTLNAAERVSVISGSDVQKASVFSQQIDGPSATKAKTSVVTSEGDIRLNAERVNIG